MNSIWIIDCLRRQQLAYTFLIEEIVLENSAFMNKHTKYWFLEKISSDLDSTHFQVVLENCASTLNI